MLKQGPEVTRTKILLAITYTPSLYFRFNLSSPYFFLSLDFGASCWDETNRVEIKEGGGGNLKVLPTKLGRVWIRNVFIRD